MTVGAGAMRGAMIAALWLGLAGGCSDDAGSGSKGGADTGRPTRADAGRTPRDATTPPDDAAGAEAGTPDDTSPPGPDTTTTCTPGARSCASVDAALVCSADGTSEAPEACPTGTFCLDPSGICRPAACRPFEVRCSGPATREACREDGSAWAPYDPCAGGDFCENGACLPATCLPRVMFLIDGSSSMTSEFPAIRRSIAAVATASPGVQYGLSMFPTGLGCSIGDGRGGLFSPGVRWPHVPIAPGGGAAIDAWFAANDAAGGATPLISSLEWFASNAATVFGNPIENAHLIVMTEGADTCRCDDNDPPSCATNALTNATRSLVAAGVKVYVIGYRYSDAPEALNAIASNGGTSFTTFLYAGSESTLTESFDRVVSSAKLCQ